MVEKNTEKIETGSNSKMTSKADSSVEMKKLSMKEPLWVSVVKVFWGVCVFLVLCGGMYYAWTSHQLNVFRDEVQAVLDSGKGLETLRLIDDWRVDNITETTKRVSRADGHYVLLVWYLPNGKYLVETVDR